VIDVASPENALLVSTGSFRNLLPDWSPN